MTMQATLSSQMTGLVQLTRWQETVPFVVPLSLMGSLLALQTAADGQGVDLRLLAVMAANILVVTYAFMINDIEDAPDDARDPARAIRNPISSGRISSRTGYNALRAVALVTMLFYAVGGTSVFIIGGATLLLSHLYSWRPVRLKAWPVTDIVSHSLMLSGLLLLAGYFVYDTAPGVVWFVAAAVTLVSVYGQLYNQLRDYDMDKAAGLNNTAIILGQNYTRKMMYLTMALAAASGLVAIVQGAFPLWLGGVALIAIPVSMFFRPSTDMRGSAVVEASGAMQGQFVFVANVIMSAWLLQVMFVQ